MPRVGPGLTGIVTLLGGGGLWFQGDPQQQLAEMPILKVNDDDSLLSHWPSEDFDADPGTAPECTWWRMNHTYDATLCSHFTIGRLSSTPARARARARACAAARAVECVLSPEVGLGVPAAFLNDHDQGEMVMVLGPRLLPLEDPNATRKQHVRAGPPDGDGMTDTRTFVFNTTVRVEFFDGITKRMHTRDFRDGDAYCLQLLRASFAAECWERLDA